MTLSLPIRRLGACGIEAPAVGIGCWGIGGPAENLGLPMGWASGSDESAAQEGLETAFTLGARLFDTADVYGLGRSERLLGRLVRQVPRTELVLVSKVGYFAGTASHGYEPGHMRRQLEQTLDNLGTDYLDVYFLHHTDFGAGSEWLDGAAEQMQSFRDSGLIRAIGMRGPHRHALERLSTPRHSRADKVERFRGLFRRVRPDVLAVRDNLLSPAARESGVYRLAAEHGVGVLVNKPLAQGLLTGVYSSSAPRDFPPGDHRRRKRWFTAEALAIIGSGLARVRALIGNDPDELLRYALWHCLDSYEHAAVLAGFTSPWQVRRNLGALGQCPDREMLDRVRRIMAGVQRRLDADGEVFCDEPTGVEAT